MSRDILFFFHPSAYHIRISEKLNRNLHVFFAVCCLTLTLIHPVSKWTHLATLRRHPCLSRAARSASSQVNPIFCRSLLTVPLQFALDRPGPLLYPGTCLFVAISYKMSRTILPHLAIVKNPPILSWIRMPIRIATKILSTRSWGKVISQHAVTTSKSNSRHLRWLDWSQSRSNHRHLSLLEPRQRRTSWRLWARSCGRSAGCGRCGPSGNSHGASSASVPADPAKNVKKRKRKVLPEPYVP